MIQRLRDFLWLFFSSSTSLEVGGAAGKRGVNVAKGGIDGGARGGRGRGLEAWKRDARLPYGGFSSCMAWLHCMGMTCIPNTT